MNDLIIPKQFDDVFPSMAEGIRRAYDIIKSIHSFEDVERMFLMGQGLSPNTYRAYLQSVKQFYDFTGGLNPLQIRPGDIEAFYDYLVKNVDRNTAYLRIRGLKKFFAGIRNVIPFYTSPFEIMSENLHRKFNKTKKGNRTKKALSKNEVKSLLHWLEADKSIIGLENYSIVYMLTTSGLRASELVQLHWKDIEYFEGTWTARFIGKGNREAEQELYPDAVEACSVYFYSQFKRKPKPEDALFWTVESYPGEEIRPMPYHTLWHRIKKIGKDAREAGIIKRELNFSPHLFRRSYATCLYKSGMGIKAIQEKTRHASIDVLVKHYIHDEEPASPYFAAMFA